MTSYERVVRGNGPRAGQLFRHVTDPSRWQIMAYIGRDVHGKKQYRTQVVHGRKKDAEAALLELLRHKSVGQLSPRTRLTPNDLAQQLAEHKARDVSPRTLSQYVAALDGYVLPSLGQRKLAHLTLRDIDYLYGQMRTGQLTKSNGERGITDRPHSVGALFA